MKIRTDAFQPYNLCAKGLDRKIQMSPADCMAESADSYTVGIGSQVEREVLQALRTVISDLKNAVDTFSGNDRRVVLPDVQIELSGRAELPSPEHEIVMFFLPKEGEVPAVPERILFSCEQDEQLLEIPDLRQLIGKVVEEADKIIRSPAGKGLSLEREDEASGNAGQPQLGLMLRFSSVSRASGKYPEVISQAVTSLGMEKDGPGHVQGWINTYNVSGQVVDDGYLKVLSGEGEGCEVLDGISSDVPVEAAANRQTGDMKSTVKPKHAVIDLRRLPATEGSDLSNPGMQFESLPEATASIKDPLSSPASEAYILAGEGRESDVFMVSIRAGREIPFSSAQDDGIVVVPLGADEVKNGSNVVLNKSVTDADNVEVAKDGELRGAMTLNAGFSQGELKSNPMAGSPLLPINSIDNNAIMAKISRFVEQVNILLGGDGDTDDEQTVVMNDPAAETSPEKAPVFQARSPEIRAIIRSTAKKVLGEIEAFPAYESVGLSRGRDDLLHLNVDTLTSELTIGRDKTAGLIRGLGNALLERVDYLMNPYAGVYLDDKNVLSLRGARKDEGACFQDDEMKNEQGSLEKRLKELRLLIESSQLLTQWFRHADKGSHDEEVQQEGTQ